MSIFGSKDRVVIPMRVYESLHRLELKVQQIRDYQRAQVDDRLMSFQGTSNEPGRCNNCGRMVRYDISLTHYGPLSASYYAFCDWACLSHWAQAKENRPAEQVPPLPETYEAEASR